jgi:hypothetical protein
MRSARRQHAVSEISLYVSSNASRRIDDNTVTIAAVRKHDAPLELIA